MLTGKLNSFQIFLNSDLYQKPDYIYPIYLSDSSLKNTVPRLLIHLSITILPIFWIIIYGKSEKSTTILYFFSFCPSHSDLKLSHSFNYSENEACMGDLQLTTSLHAHKCLSFTSNCDSCLMPYSCSFVPVPADGGTRPLGQSASLLF